MAAFLRRLTLRLVGTLLTRGTEVEIPLDDELLVKLSVLDTVAVQSAATRDVRAERAYLSILDGPPISVHDGMKTQLRELGRYFVRCNECWAGEPIAPVYYLPPRTERNWNLARMPEAPSPLNWTDEQIDMRYYDYMFGALPFMCRHAVLHDFEANQTGITVAMHRVRIVIPARNLDLFEPGLRPEHRPDCRRAEPATFAEFERDGLGAYSSIRSTYRYSECVTGINCVWCNESALHGVFPAVFDTPVQHGRWRAGVSWLTSAWRMNRIVLEMPVRPTHVAITGWNRDYCPIEAMPQLDIPMFVLVCDQQDWDTVVSTGRIPLYFHLVGSERTLGNARLWMAYALPVGTVAVVMNAYLRGPWLFDLSRPQAAPVECLSITLRCAGMGASLVVAGSIRLPQVMPMSRAALFSNNYAFEEAVLMRCTTPVTRVDHFFESMTMLWDFRPNYRRRVPVVFRSSQDERYAMATGGSRNNTLTAFFLVRAWARSAQRSIGWAQALSLPLGSFLEVPGSDIVTVPGQPRAREGLPTSISGAISSSIGVVNWFTFGSTGDVVPILALARHLRGWGIDVNVVRTHSQEEGVRVLRAAEQGRLLEAAPYFAQAMTASATAPGVVFGPPEFPAVHVGVNLRPPATLVHPTDFGMGWLVNYVLDNLLRGWAPIVNVGAYRGVHWLPRSADGMSFLRRIKGGPRPIPILLAWGSSSMPKPVVSGAVEVEPGDHVSQFAQAQVVVTHGGAGTVQTAAACGARVVSGSSVLDRNYRDPLNAGAGVSPGADPDSVMLMLLPVTPLVWIWAWKHSWTMFIRCVRWAVFWQIGPALWLFVALLVKGFVFVLRLPHIRLVFTTTASASILATTLSSSLGPWVAAIVSPQLETFLRYVMTYFGATYMSVFLGLVNIFASASLSPLTWVLVLSGAGWIAVPIHLVTSMLQVGAVLFSELLMALFRTRAAPGRHGYALVAVSFAFDNSWIPAFHTRFVSSSLTRAYQGRWVARLRGLDALYQMSEGPYTTSTSPEWTFETSIPWEFFNSAKTMSAPYSPLWNCQSAMLFVTRGMWSSLGLALFIMAPMGLWMLLALTGAAVGICLAIFLMDVVPFLTLAFIACGMESSIVPTKLYLAHFMTALTSAPNDWFATSMAVLVGMSSGWASSTQDVARDMDAVKQIIMAQDITSLVAVAYGGGLRSVLALRLYQAKLQFFV